MERARTQFALAARREAIGGPPRRPGPGHEFVEARGWPEIDEFCEHVGEVGLRIDAMQFAGLDKRGDGCPVLRPLIVAGEERVLPTSLDDVGVEFDAAVFEEANEPVPMVQAVADGFGDDGLRRDARELPGTATVIFPSSDKASSGVTMSSGRQTNPVDCERYERTETTLGAAFATRSASAAERWMRSVASVIFDSRGDFRSICARCAAPATAHMGSTPARTTA